MSNNKKTISQKFHNQTKVRKSPKATLDPKDWPAEWKKIYNKTYPRLQSTNLPTKTKLLMQPLSQVLMNRKSRRQFSRKALPLETLSSLLFYSLGVIPGSSQSWNETRRFYPSAGARYPLEIYFTSHNIEKLENGLYHYNVPVHKLERLMLDEKINKRIAKLCFQDWIEQAQMVMVITAVFSRTQNKYGERGYRHILLEAGHVGQNIYLIAEALELKVCAIGGFLDDEINKLLDIDCENESAIYLLAVGL